MSAADLRVLVVDDDFHVARMHAQLVDAVPGFAALEPEPDGRRVLARAAAETPDLVLLDVHLPQGSGLDLLARLEVDAMVLSAAAEAASVRTALRRGALAYLIKPFDPAVLTGKLRAYARYRRLLESAAALDQATIERAQRVMFGGDEAVATTAAPTEQSILDAVRSAAPVELTVAEVAEAVGVSRATAQRYLSHLAREGVLRLELRYGQRGRPEHRYSAG